MKKCSSDILLITIILVIVIVSFLIIILVMDARSAMRPCYILPMFYIYIYFYGRLSWPNG